MSQFIEMFGDCVNRIKLSSLCSTFVDGDWIESKDQSELGIRLIQTGNVGNGFLRIKRISLDILVKKHLIICIVLKYILEIFWSQDYLTLLDVLV